MMTFDLSGFLDKGENVYCFNGELDFSEYKHDDKNFRIIGPVNYNGKIFKVDGDYIINADISYKYESMCDRCLKPTTDEIKTVLSGKLIEDSGGKYNEDDYEEIIYYKDNLLDLDKYIKSQVIMSIPMKFLCSKKCKGLCSKCGVDLNVEECNCSHESIDPRLEKLKDFFPKE